jgi:hypothetical protein
MVPDPYYSLQYATHTKQISNFTFQEKLKYRQLSRYRYRVHLGVDTKFPEEKIRAGIAKWRNAPNSSEFL